MPAVDDYDKDQEDAATGRGGVARGGGTLAAPTPQKESTFTPWSRFVSANEDVSKREAGDIAGQAQGDINAATNARDEASNAQSQAVQSNYAGYEAPTKPAKALPGVENAAPSAFGEPTAFAGANSHAPEPAPAPEAPPPEQRPHQMPASLGVAPLTRTEGPRGVKDIYRLGGIDPNRLSTDISSGQAHTTGSGITGAKSLEDQMGAPAWSKLLGDTQHAQQEANALGSETGVQGVIQSQAAQPLAQGGAFDAALINGQGAPQFRAINQQYGNGQLNQSLVGANQDAASRWQKLYGDVNAATKAREGVVNGALTDTTGMAQAGAAGQPGADQLAYLQSHFPIPNGWGDMTPQPGEHTHNWSTGQAAFIDWMDANRYGGNNTAMQSWADQIYGPNADIEQFYRDVQLMTPEEYQAFLYGVVPSWMGLGSAASGGAGGGFWGLGNTGDRVTGETTNDPTSENAQDWNSKQEALKAYYEVLAAVAGAGVA